MPLHTHTGLQMFPNVLCLKNHAQLKQLQDLQTCLQLEDTWSSASSDAVEEDSPHETITSLYHILHTLLYWVLQTWVTWHPMASLSIIPICTVDFQPQPQPHHIVASLSVGSREYTVGIRRICHALWWESGRSPQPQDDSPVEHHIHEEGRQRSGVWHNK